MAEKDPVEPGAEGTGGPLGGKIKEIRSVLQMAFEAGRAKGREEARRELLGIPDSTKTSTAGTVARKSDEADK